MDYLTLVLDLAALICLAIAMFNTVRLGSLKVAAFFYLLGMLCLFIGFARI